MNTATPSQKIETLFGGRVAMILREDGKSEEIKIRQLRINEYETAFTVVDDEFAFTALCCGKDKQWILGNDKQPTDPDCISPLQPESFEKLQADAKEVNAKGFFSYATRRQERANAQQTKLLAQLAAMPPETVRIAAEIGKSTSPTSLPKPR